MTTRILVMSRDAVNRYDALYSSLTAYISISDPNGKGAFIRSSNILRLQFHDIDREMEGWRAISRLDANRIAFHVRNNWDIVETLIVNCEAGISRSAGVAAAISKHFTGNDEYYFNSGRYIPNRRCYCYVLDALSASVSMKFKKRQEDRSV